MDRDLINRIRRSKAFGRSAPDPAPPTSFRFGEIRSDASGGWADVRLDGDDDNSRVRTPDGLVYGDRVVVANINGSLVFMQWVQPQS